MPDYVAEKADSRIGNKFNLCVTNCITEIPQDIKYEIFEEGEAKRLKILTGTKYWVPDGLDTDGTKKFKYGVLTDDLICPNLFWSDEDANTEQVFLVFKDNSITVNSSGRIGSNISSGETAPTTFLFEYALWYDTKENYIKFTEDSGATWVHCSFPLLSGQPKITYGWTQGVTQVYNGFGFIGSTIYALPGVKGLIPDGRNDDGTLKNLSFETKTVYLDTSTLSRTVFTIGSNGFTRYAYYADSQAQPETAWTLWYNSQSNKMFESDGTGTFKQAYRVPIARIIRNETTYNVNGKSFSPRKAYKSVDYSDGSFLSSRIIPSGNYLDLTLGASGSTYTAPANGWFYLKKEISSDAKQYCIFVVNGDVYQIGSAPTGTNSTFLIAPVQSGQQIKVVYTATGATSYFRFIYAEGDQ